MMPRTLELLTFGWLLAWSGLAWGQGVYPYPYAGRPSGPRTVYYPAQPVQAAVPAAAPVVTPPANTIPVTAGYASAAYAPAPYAGWAANRHHAAQQPLTWFPNTGAAPAPVVTGYAPAAVPVAAPQAYIKPAGGGLIPAAPAAPAVAVPAPPVVSIPATAGYAPQPTPTAFSAPATAPAPVTTYSPITAYSPAAPAHVAPAPVAQATIPATVAAPVTAFSPAVATPVAPASGGYFPITVPGAAVGTTGTSVPGYVAYSNPYAKYYVPPVFAYRPYSKSVPVTYYRPVAAIDPASGQQVTYMAPCVGVEQQPYTTRRVFAHQPAASCGPQGCRSSCNGGTCAAPSPYYQPAPPTTAPAVVVPGAGAPAATIPPSLPPSTVIPSTPPPTFPSTTVPPSTLPSTTIPATPLPPAGAIPAAPTFPGFNLPRTTIPPPATVFPGTSGASVVPPTTVTPGTSTTIRSLPGGSGADLAPRLDPNYVPSTPGNAMYPPIDDGARSSSSRTGVSPDAVLDRAEPAATATQRPLIKIPFHSTPAQAPMQTNPAPASTNPSFSAPLNGKTISEPGSTPRTVPVPDPDHPPVYNRAPQLINPRDKTA